MQVLAQAAEEKNYFGGFLLKKKKTGGILGATIRKQQGF
jgi:hypothetical protein